MRHPPETEGRLLRNARPARRFHSALYLLTFLLLLSGVAVGGEGHPSIEALLGGHLATAQLHRWIGFLLLAMGLAVLAIRPRPVRRFLTESIRFRRSDLSWFARYPRFLIRPRTHAPAPHEGHFDPGQRVYNCVALLALVVLAATGTLMSFPNLFTAEAYRWSILVHRGATWVLGVAVAGHVAVGSGVLPAYRGVWRAAHLDGEVPAGLARRLWPRWAEGSRPGRH